LAIDPDLVRAFVPPTIKGFLYARQYPDEAATIVKKYLPTVDLALRRRYFLEKCPKNTSALARRSDFAFSTASIANARKAAVIG
jgi:ABC-type nitrate/sulfonate/bicarbonate transport system substrate-binding protein